MAINKVINQPTLKQKSLTKEHPHDALRGVLNYVLQDKKVIGNGEYVSVAGPYPYNVITPNNLFNSWLKEKELWNKDSGRMYYHFVISFHKEESISPSQVLELCASFRDHFIHNYQSVIAVHQDKDHLHGHIVFNSVSFIDGYKYQQSKDDLQRQKNYTNTLCMLRGFHVPEKGKHFDGSSKELFEINAWDKKVYRQVIRDPELRNVLKLPEIKKTKKSFYFQCAKDILSIKDDCCNRDQFIDAMEGMGWKTTWNASKKRIIFEDATKNKVSNQNLSQTFAGVDLSMATLELSFKKARKREKEEEAELNSFYRDVENDIACFDKIPISSTDFDKRDAHPTVDNSSREAESEPGVEDLDEIVNDDLEDIDF